MEYKTGHFCNEVSVFLFRHEKYPLYRLCVAIKFQGYDKPLQAKATIIRRKRSKTRYLNVYLS